MSYLWTRKAVATPDGVFDAMGFGTEITAFVNKKHPSLNVQFYVQTMGQTNTLVWTANFDSVDEFHGIFASLMQDKEYAGLIKNAGKHFVAGKAEDALYMQIPNN